MKIILYQAAAVILWEQAGLNQRPRMQIGQFIDSDVKKNYFKKGKTSRVSMYSILADCPIDSTSSLDSIAK